MNSNCLEGIRCPECGAYEPFTIVAKAVFEVFDDGTDSFRDVEWTDGSRILCEECGRSGKIKEFKI